MTSIYLTVFVHIIDEKNIIYFFRYQTIYFDYPKELFLNKFTEEWFMCPPKVISLSVQEIIFESHIFMTNNNLFLQSTPVQTSPGGGYSEQADGEREFTIFVF